MNKIPVTFEFEGKQYTGSLDEVGGVGTGVWQLMVNNYYWGRLRKVGDAWYFDESNWPVAYLIDHFAETVIAWYQ